MSAYPASATPWTADQAREWRRARVPWWANPRWSGLGWLVVLIVSVVAEGEPTECGGDTGTACPIMWVDPAIAAIVIGQVGLALVAPAVGTVTRRVVLALMVVPAPFGLVIGHTWVRWMFEVCAAWTFMAVGYEHRAHRKQIAALPGHRVTTALPPAGSLPWAVRRRLQLLAGLLVVAGGVALITGGVVRQLVENDLWRRAEILDGTVTAVDEDGLRIRVRIADGTERWLHTYVAEYYPPGTALEVRVNGDWARLEPYDPFWWALGGYLSLIFGTTVTGYAAHWRHGLRKVWRGPSRLLVVKVRRRGANFLILPADGPDDKPLLIVPSHHVLRQDGSSVRTDQLREGEVARRGVLRAVVCGDPCEGAALIIRTAGLVFLPAGPARMPK